MLSALFIASAAFQALAMKNSEMAVICILVPGSESVLAFLLGMVAGNAPAQDESQASAW
ncbi:MAG TPA: hypothetical protein VIY49_20635 [Bryobacteraceae bacterium]